MPIAKVAASLDAEKKVETKAAEVKAAVAEKKEEVKKVAAPAKKTAAPKKAAAVKKVAAPAKKAAVAAEVMLQFAEKEYTQESLLKIAKDVWQYDMNQKAADFKTVEIYVKPEENTAYFVVNGEFPGSFVL